MSKADRSFTSILLTMRRRGVNADNAETPRRAALHKQPRQVATMGPRLRQLTDIYCDGYLSHHEFQQLSPTAILLDFAFPATRLATPNSESSNV